LFGFPEEKFRDPPQVDTVLAKKGVRKGTGEKNPATI
jgi:hypothetical protein